MEHFVQFRVGESRRRTADRGRSANCGMVERTAKRVSADHSSRADDDQPLLRLGRGHDSANAICETVSSTGGVRIRRLDEAQRCEARPRIPRHLAEPPIEPRTHLG
jgi:hypothetical protein